MTGRVFAAVLLTYIAAAGGHLYTTDEETHYRTAESILLRGTLAVEPAADRPLNIAVGRDGRTYAYYPPGLAILLVPFVAAGRALGAVAGESTYLPRAVASLLGPVLGASTVAGAAALMRRHGLPAGAIAAGAAATAFACYLWPATEAPGSQAASAAGLVWIAVALAAGRPGAAGALAGGLALIRYEAPLIATVLAAPTLGRHTRAWARFGAAAAGGLALAGAANAARFGAPWTTGYPEVAEGLAAGFATPWREGLAGLVASPARGFVWYAPAALLGAAGLAAAARRGDRIAGGGLLAALASLLLYARAVSWHTPFWGPRHLTGAVALCGLGLGGVLARWSALGRPARAAAGALLAAGLGVNILGVAASFDAHIDRMVERGRPVEAWLWDWSVNPFAGQVETLRSVTWGRVTDAPQAGGFLPAGGGHPWTQELRRSIDVWAVYAYKVGAPAWLCATLWAGNVAAAAWAWRRVAEAVRAA